jgi:hypothetical protein
LGPFSSMVPAPGVQLPALAMAKPFVVSKPPLVIVMLPVCPEDPMVTVPEVVNCVAELNIREAFPVPPIPMPRVVHFIPGLSTVTSNPPGITAASPEPMPCTLYGMELFDETALAVNVMEVALFTERTVPITVLAASFKILPALTCVRKLVPDPVTMVEAEELLMVPARVVFGQAVALQFPDAVAVMVAAGAREGKVKIKMKRDQNGQLCKIDFIFSLFRG